MNGAELLAECPCAVQVSEAELAAIAKGAGPEVDADVAYGAGGEATRRLLGDYETPNRSALHLMHSGCKLVMHKYHAGFPVWLLSCYVILQSCHAVQQSLFKRLLSAAVQLPDSGQIAGAHGAACCAHVPGYDRPLKSIHLSKTWHSDALLIRCMACGRFSASLAPQVCLHTHLVLHMQQAASCMK